VSDLERRPRSVYDEGDEPDPRFTLANERTFLAWIRTSLGLTAGGVALDSFASAPDGLQRPVAVLLVLLGIACGAMSYRRWMEHERALRRDEPLPALAGGVVLGAGVTLVGVALLVAIVAQ
jgi:putative membrane protein